MPGTKENFQFIEGYGNKFKKPSRRVGDPTPRMNLSDPAAKKVRDSMRKRIKTGMKKAASGSINLIKSGKLIKKPLKDSKLKDKIKPSGIRKADFNMNSRRRKDFFDRKERSKEIAKDREERKRNVFRGGGVCVRGKGRAYGKNS